MHIDWWTLALQTINAVVLIWILSRFLFRPVAAMIATRQAEARRLLDEAGAAKAEATAEAEKARAQEADLAAWRSAAIAAATKEADAQKAAILAAANQEAERLRKTAEEARARDAARAETAAEQRAAKLAVDISAKLLERLPDGVRIAAFVDGLAAGIAELPQAVRDEIGSGGAPVRLKAPRALTDGETATLATALGKALGHPVTVAADIDPDLIAGLELETDHAIVRNCLRADLDHIARELARDDRS